MSAGAALATSRYLGPISKPTVTINYRESHFVDILKETTKKVVNNYDVPVVDIATGILNNSKNLLTQTWAQSLISAENMEPKKKFAVYQALAERMNSIDITV
jgi:hypothetical protein